MTVDQDMRIDVPFHVPEPYLAKIAELTPPREGYFVYPPTLDPRAAETAYAEAGIQLSFTPTALSRIKETRRITFEYETTGRVWLRTGGDVSPRDLLDERMLKTFAVWSNFHDAWRLRQAGALGFAKEAIESKGIKVDLIGFPKSRVRLPKLKFPHRTNVRLYPFQREAVRFVLRQNGRAAIFDEMGLGKTITSTDAALRLVQIGESGRILVVAPNAVLEQWRKELVQKFNLDPTVVTSRFSLGERGRLYNNPLVVMNYELLRIDIELILQKQFDTLILDEATRVKNWNTQTSEAVKKLIVRNVIVLTGTPLENRLSELYNIINIVRPGFFGRFREDFLSQYTSFSGSSHAREPQLTEDGAKQLRRQLEFVAIRRVKKEVMRELPRLISEYIYTEPARNQRRVYDLLQLDLRRAIIAELRYGSQEFEGLNPFTANRIRLYNLLRETCADISMIVRYLNRKEEEESEDARKLRASKFFHHLRRFVASLEPENAKLLEVQELVQELVAQGHKIVLFSQYIPVVELVKNTLQDLGHTTLVFHGALSEDERNQNLQIFLKDPSCRVLASTEAGQFGLNLQVADVVINYDLPWNPARLQQRIARLHRIGQEQTVLAINFVVKGTIEEYVRDVLEGKMELFHQVTGTALVEDQPLGLNELCRILKVDYGHLITRKKATPLVAESPSKK